MKKFKKTESAQLCVLLSSRDIKKTLIYLLKRQFLWFFILLASCSLALTFMTAHRSKQFNSINSKYLSSIKMQSFSSKLQFSSVQLKIKYNSIHSVQNFNSVQFSSKLNTIQFHLVKN